MFQVNASLFLGPGPLLAAAGTDDPVGLARDLWAPEVQADPQRLKELLEQSIKTTAYPADRCAVLRYLSDHTAIMEDLEIIDSGNPWVLKAVGYGSLAALAATITFCSVILKQDQIRDETPILITVSLGLLLLYTALRLRAPFRSDAALSAYADGRWNDVDLLAIGAAVAFAAGDPALADHFNALQAKQLYESRFKIQNCAYDLDQLAVRHGSIHAYHYARLLAPQPTYEHEASLRAAFPFCAENVRAELEGDRRAQNCNLIKLMSHPLYRSGFTAYLGTQATEVPQSYQLASELLAHIETPSATASPRP